MREKPVLAIIVLLGSFAVAPTARAAAVVEQKAELTRVTGTRVRMVLPAGYEPTSSFTGFMNSQNGCSLMVSEVPAPFGQVKPGLTDAGQLLRQGMQLIEHEDRPIGRHDGKLIKVRQKAQGVEVVKWLWGFGNDDVTVIVVGVCPKEVVDTELDTVKAAVLSSVWDLDMEVDPLDGLAYSIKDTGGMKLLNRASSMIAFSPDGEAGTDEEGHSKPLFVVAPGMRPVEEERPVFAEKLMQSTAGYRDIESGPFTPVTVDGLPGLSCTATALYKREPTFIYQLVLFEGDTHWHLKGLAPEKHRDTYLPIFRRMARSFERGRTTLRSDAMGIEATVPDTWSMRAGLNESADLQAGHPVASCFFIVLTEPKSDFGEDVTYEDHSRLTRGALERDGELAAGPTSLVIGGRPAIQYEYRSPDGIHYLHVTVDGKESFHQILVWCLERSLDASRPDLEKVLMSFREVG